MQFENCISAINFMKRNPEVSTNVEKKQENVICGHFSTPCDWVGNDIHYACLTTEHIHPQKVYTHLNSGGHGIILNDNTS